MSILERLWSSSANSCLRAVGLMFAVLAVVVFGLSLVMVGAVIVRLAIGLEGVFGLVPAFSLLLTALGLAAVAALFRAAERIVELLEEAIGSAGVGV